MGLLLASAVFKRETRIGVVSILVTLTDFMFVENRCPKIFIQLLLTLMPYIIRIFRYRYVAKLVSSTLNCFVMHTIFQHKNLYQQKGKACFISDPFRIANRRPTFLKQSSHGTTSISFQSRGALAPEARQIGISIAFKTFSFPN